MRFHKLRIQLLIVSTFASVLLLLVSLHEYKVSLSGTTSIDHHAAWHLYASLSLITGLHALFLGIGRWRFSLRTLLIATTVIAVLLGLIVWFSQ